MLELLIQLSVLSRPPAFAGNGSALRVPVPRGHVLFFFAFAKP